MRGYVKSADIAERIGRHRDAVCAWCRGKRTSWPRPKRVKGGGNGQSPWWVDEASVERLVAHLERTGHLYDLSTPAYSAPAPNAIRWLLTPGRAAEAAGISLDRFDKLEARGEGPALILYGSGERRYKRRDVQRWLHFRTVVRGTTGAPNNHQKETQHG